MSISPCRYELLQKEENNGKLKSKMGSGMMQCGLSSVQAAAHKTRDHHTQLAYSPARPKHTPTPCPPFGTSVTLKIPALQRGTSEL